MSFILDALKKSEMERQRQTLPGLVDTPVLRSRTRLPGWAIAVGALLAVNLLVVSWLLVRGVINSPHESPAALKGTPPAGPAAGSAGSPANAPREAAGESAAPAASDHFSPLDGAAVYAPEIPVTTGTAAESAAPPPSLAAPGPLAAPPHASRRHDPVLSNDDYRPADEEVLPTINEVSLAGTQALPELHLDVHVYATKPAERFVYVNMRKYHEGAMLEEGPTVERIRRDGVVLNYQGLRFLLPRQ